MHVAVKVVAVLLAILVVGLVVLGSLADRQARASLETAQEGLAADWRRVEAEVLRDQARWQDDPLLSPRDGGDAAALLFAHVRWDGVDGGGLLGPPPLPEPLLTQLEAWKETCFEHVDEAQLEGLDLVWMGQLAAFGFWDLESEGSPIAKAPYAHFTEPVPMFLDVQRLARARLLQGLREGTVVAAAAEVRELARLSFTTEHLVGEMVGVGLLSVEAKAHAEAVKRGVDVAGWAPLVEEAARGQLKRALWAANAPTSMLATGVVASTRLPVGRCSALREGLGNAHFLRRYTERLVPERYEALTAALADSPCRLRRARLAWATQSTEGQPPISLCDALDEREGACQALDGLRYAPFVRTLAGASLLNISNPDWLQHYRAP